MTRAASLAVSMFVLARALGPAGRGEVAAAIAPMTAASAAFAGGLPDAVSHFVAKFPRWARKTMFRALLIALFLGVLGAISVTIASRPLADGRASLQSNISWVGLVVVPALWVVVLRAHASGQQAWKRVSYEAIGSGALQVVGLSALWASSLLTVRSALVVMALGTFIGGLAYLRQDPVASSATQPYSEAEVTYKMIWRFSAAAWLGAVGMVGLTYLDQMLMVPLASVEQLGIYALAINIASLLSVVTVSIRSVVLVNESAAVDFQRLAKHARFSLLISLGVGVAVAACLPILVPAIFGDAFSGSVVPALILLPPLIITASGSVATAGLMALGRPWFRSISIAFGMAVNLVLVILLVPPLGATGAAMAMIASAIPPLMSILFLRRFYSLRVKDFLIPRVSDLKALLTR